MADMTGAGRPGNRRDPRYRADVNPSGAFYLSKAILPVSGGLYM